MGCERQGEEITTRIGRGRETSKEGGKKKRPQELRERLRWARREKMMRPIISLHGGECSWLILPQEPRENDQRCHTIQNERSHQYYNLHCGLLKTQMNQRMEGMRCTYLFAAPTLDSLVGDVK
jgi:hypothetical protein